VGTDATASRRSNRHERHDGHHPGVTAGTYTVGTVAPGGTAALRVEVTTQAGAAAGAVQPCLVTATSTATTSVSDAVLARITRS
jgi:hypothetical protein